MVISPKKHLFTFILSFALLLGLGVEGSFAKTFRANWHFPANVDFFRPAFEDTIAYVPSEQGVYFFDTALNAIKNVKHSFYMAHAAAVTPDGTKWFGFANNLIKYTDDGSTTVYSPSDVGLDNTAFRLAPTNDNYVWVGTFNGIGRVDGNGNWDNILHTDTVPGVTGLAEQVLDIVIDLQGNLWIATKGGLVYWEPGTQNHQGYTTANGLPDNDIRAIALGPASNNIEHQYLYVGTFSNGISFFDPLTKTVVKNYLPSQIFPDTISNDRIYDVTVSGPKVYFSMLWNVLIYDVSSDTFSILDVPSYIHSGANGAAVANDGSIWFGSISGGLTDTDGQNASGIYILSPDSKAWTLIMYYALDNDLDESDYPEELLQLKNDLNPYINRVALVDASNRFSGRFSFSGTKRFVLGNGKIETYDLGELNTASGSVLSDFILWTMKNYPAEHYALLLDNHGIGIKGDNEVPVTNSSGFPPSGQAIGVDEQVVVKGQWDQLTIREIQNSIKNVLNATGNRIDVVVFHACLMQMIEVAYELRDYTDYIVGGQSTIWTNHKLDYLSRFNDQTTPFQAAYYFFDNYRENVSLATAGLSIVSTAYLEPLRIALDNLVAPLNLHASDSNYYNLVMSARKFTQMFNLDYEDPSDTRNSSIDIYDFAKNLSDFFTGTDDTVVNRANDVQVALDAAVVRNSFRSGFVRRKFRNYESAHGLSIFFPPARGPVYDTTLAGYTGDYFEFAQNSDWDSFLQNYVRDSGETTASFERVRLVGSNLGEITVNDSITLTLTGVTYTPLGLQLYYDTDTDGVGGTLIDSTTVYETASIYNQYTWSPTWDVTRVRVGNYYIYGVQSDGITTQVFHVEPVFHVDTTITNIPPRIVITNVSNPKPGILLVSWEDWDPDDNARIRFYVGRDTNFTGATLIPTDTPIYEDSGTYDYRTGQVHPEYGDAMLRLVENYTTDFGSLLGNIYVFAEIGDGKDTSVAIYDTALYLFPPGDVSRGNGFDASGGDNLIDLADFRVFSDQYGRGNGDMFWILETDLDGNGVTDFEDIVTLGRFYGFRP